MDVLRILTRSTKLQRTPTSERSQSIPSAGASSRPRILADISTPRSDRGTKRKRSKEDAHCNGDDQRDFFSQEDNRNISVAVHSHDNDPITEPERERAPRDLTVEDRKSILNEHKIKICVVSNSDDNNETLLSSEKANKTKRYIFPRPLQSFEELSERYNLSSRLVRNLLDQGYTEPTEIQLAALPLLCAIKDDDIEEDLPKGREINLLTVAPTGSGKTLAFLVPVMHDILFRRHLCGQASSSNHVDTIVLAPTHELVDQIVNEGRKFALGTGLKISPVQKGITIAQDELQNSIAGPSATSVRSDIVVGTPAAIWKAAGMGSITTRTLPNVRNLVLDEADILLDPLFRDETSKVWDSCCNPNLRVSLWSATLGSSVESLARERLLRRPEPETSNTSAARGNHQMVRIIAGLKDSAIPNVKHSMVYAANEQGKLIAMRNLLHPPNSSTDNLKIRPPLLVFTQTIARAIALHSELLYDVPLEAGGAARIAVLHSDLPISKRGDVMTRFRKGEVWVLITTDILSRGIDFRGINGVVNYDIPSSGSAYVHRAGRTGRTGREGGVCVTLYTKEDIPYMKSIANIIATTEKLKGTHPQDEASTVPRWLLDALPHLSKETRKDLKRRGVAARRRKKRSNLDGKSQMRISTKSGYERRLEHRCKDSRLARQPRDRETPRLGSIESKDDSNGEFDGFDD